MATQLLPINPGTLPIGACYNTEQERLVAFANNMEAVLDGGYAFYNFGSTKPTAPNQAYPWFRTTDGRWYFYSGQWRSPMNYTAFDRRLFYGSLTDLQTYDGGDTGTPSATSGPTWVEDTAFRGRSPMGPGAIPSSNPAKTLNQGEAFGEGAHAQTVAELAVHSHPPRSVDATGFVGYPGVPAGNLVLNSTSGNDTATSATTGDAGSGAAANICHPVVGIYVIKWNQVRQFYIVT